MSVHEKILQWLENELFEGNLHLGQDLPDDRRLATLVGASNSSTREALKTLETMGIVRLYEGKRKTIIAHLVSSPLSSAGSALRLHMADARFPLRDTVEAQILLESWAVLRQNPPQEALEQLENVLEAMLNEDVLPPDFHALEVEFHVALAKLSNNHMVSALMATMHKTLHETKIEMLGRVPLWSTFATRARAEYQAILSAVKSGDRELAAQLVTANIRGQYAEANLNLDEETFWANALPGSEHNQTYFEPVDIDADDLIPETWDESGTDILNTEPESEAEEVFDEIEDTEEEKTVSALETSSQKPENEPAPVSLDLLRALENVQPVSAPSSITQSVVSSEDYEDNDTDKILRAPTAAPRKLRGKVTTPVHATVIRPRSATSTQSAIASGYLSADKKLVQAAKKTSAKQAGWQAQVDGDTVRAVPRAHVGKSLNGEAVPASAEVIKDIVPDEAPKKNRGFFGRFFGTEEEIGLTRTVYAEKTSEPVEAATKETANEPEKVQQVSSTEETDKQEVQTAEPESSIAEPELTRAQLRAQAKKEAAERKAAAKAEARRRREEEKAEIERLAIEQVVKKNSDSSSGTEKLPDGYIVYTGKNEKPVYEDDLPGEVTGEEIDTETGVEKEPAKDTGTIYTNGNALNKNKKKKKKKRH